MTNILRSIYKRLPFNSVLNRWSAERSSRQEIAEWEKNGKPLPPPHIIKQRTILDFAKRHDVRILVETGTYFGDMVEAMKDKFDRVYSIELSKELHQKATQRFANDENVELIQGDSGIELEKLMSRIDQTAIFWLDGHYSAGVTAMGEQATPIFKELTHIFADDKREHIIIIDDARCFGTDPDYPSLESLSEFVLAKIPNAAIEVDNDSIRIIPQNLLASSAA